MGLSSEETLPTLEFRESYNGPEHQLAAAIADHTITMAVYRPDSAARPGIAQPFGDPMTEQQDLINWVSKLDVPLRRLQQAAPYLFGSCEELIVCRPSAYKDNHGTADQIDHISLGSTEEGNTHRVFVMPPLGAQRLIGMAQTHPDGVDAWLQAEAERFGVATDEVRMARSVSSSGLIAVKDRQDWVQFLAKGIRQHDAAIGASPFAWSNSVKMAAYGDIYPLDAADKGYRDAKSYLVGLEEYEIGQTLSAQDRATITGIMKYGVQDMYFSGKSTPHTSLSNGSIRLQADSDHYGNPRHATFYSVPSISNELEQSFALGNAGLRDFVIKPEGGAVGHNGHVLAFDERKGHLLYFVADPVTNGHRGIYWQRIAFRLKQPGYVTEIVERTKNNPEAFRWALYMGARGLFKPPALHDNTEFKPGIISIDSATVTLADLQQWRQAETGTGNSIVLDPSSFRANSVLQKEYDEPRGLIT